ncbi:MAG: Ig-like domain-containing protein, partial [Bacteroidota bacterium]
MKYFSVPAMAITGLLISGSIFLHAGVLSARAASGIYFTSPAAGQTLTGKAVLSAQSDDLTIQRVEFFIEIVGEKESIGVATYDESAKTWNYNWDTGETVNGIYNITARAESVKEDILTNAITVQVENELDADNAETQIVPVNLLIKEPENDATLKGDVFLVLKSNLDLTAATFILHQADGRPMFSGRATQSPSDPAGRTWVLGLKTDRFPNGGYYVMASTILGEKKFYSSKVNLVFKNESAPRLSKIDLVTPGANLKGLVKLVATLDAPAEKVEFKLLNVSDLTDAKLSGKPSAGHWLADWDTFKFTDGPYNVSVVAYQGSLVLESESESVTVNNLSGSASGSVGVNNLLGSVSVSWPTDRQSSATVTSSAQEPASEPASESAQELSASGQAGSSPSLAAEPSKPASSGFHLPSPVAII